VLDQSTPPETSALPWDKLKHGHQRNGSIDNWACHSNYCNPWSYAGPHLLQGWALLTLNTTGGFLAVRYSLFCLVRPDGVPRVLRPYVASRCGLTLQLRGKLHARVVMLLFALAIALPDGRVARHHEPGGKLDSWE
jgi:hypothetical protein